MTSADRQWIEGLFSDLGRKMDGIKKEVVNNKVDIAVLKIKCGVIGMLAGMIPVTVTILVYYFRG